MRGRRFWHFIPIVLSLAVAGFPAQRVVAQDPPPPEPTGHQEASTTIPLQPATGLYDQMSPANWSRIISQDSNVDLYDAKAADDFFVNPGSNSWQITAVEVDGQYNGGPGSVNSVNVEFYADAGGLPGYRVYAATVQPVSGTASTGAFFLPLNPTVQVAANATYWVSVQAIQATTWNWYWKEGATQHQSASAWKNPSNGFSTGCVNFTAINQCFKNEGPDLLFRLYGTQSTNYVTPVLLSLNPSSAVNRTFTLNASGIGFANGAKVDWKLGTTQQFATTVSSSAQLTAIVPAAAVASYKAIVSVTVTNPGPCSGSCTSNALTFSVSNSTYLPLVRR